MRYYAQQAVRIAEIPFRYHQESTGRTAAAWIDYFVINEAKNLLRFSGMNVQQVAYSMNFSNQSSFGKYFQASHRDVAHRLSTQQLTHQTEFSYVI